MSFNEKSSACEAYASAPTSLAAVQISKYVIMTSMALMPFRCQDPTYWFLIPYLAPSKQGAAQTEGGESQLSCHQCYTCQLAMPSLTFKNLHGNEHGIR